MEFDTSIDTNLKGAVVMIVERKSGYGFIAKAANKTSVLVSASIMDKLKPIAAKVKKLTFDNDKSLQRMHILMNSFKAQSTLPDHLLAGRVGAMKTSMVCCRNTSQKKIYVHGH